MLDFALISLTEALRKCGGHISTHSLYCGHEAPILLLQTSRSPLFPMSNGALSPERLQLKMKMSLVNMMRFMSREWLVS